ncbi:hypothetical protein [Eikenella corrodens]|nr:hypothetical protein [Eikenella corrodens]
MQRTKGYLKTNKDFQVAFNLSAGGHLNGRNNVSFNTQHRAAASMADTV